MVPILLALGIGLYFSGFAIVPFSYIIIFALSLCAIALIIRNKFPFLKIVLLIIFLSVLGMVLLFIGFCQSGL